RQGRPTCRSQGGEGTRRRKPRGVHRRSCMPESPARKSKTKPQPTARLKARIKTKPKPKAKAKTGSQPRTVRLSPKPARPSAPRVGPAARAPLAAPRSELEQRNAELAVINSIQEGMAAKLEFQAIINLVGDKLRELFDTDEVIIRWHDPKTDRIHYLYFYEHGAPLEVPSVPASQSATWRAVASTRRPLVANSRAEMGKKGIVP